MDLVDKIFALISLGWSLFMAIFFGLMIEKGRNTAIKNGWFKNVLRIVYIGLGALFAFYFFVVLFS